MSAHHDPEHERILRQVVCEELAPDDPAVRELASRCASCRSELEELGLITATLENWGEEERGVLEEALDSIGDEDVRLVRRLAPARAGAPRRRRTAWGFLAAAAIVTIALFAWWGRERADVDRGRHFLGDSDPQCLRPVGQVERYDEFAWDWGGLREESFTLVIWNAGDASPILRVPRLKSSAWTPTPEQEASLGEEIRWEVRRLGAGGELVNSIQAFAWH